MKKYALIIAVSLVALISTSITLAATDNEIRSQVADLSQSEFTWNAANFAGFYYDIDKNIGTEQITFHLSRSTPNSSALSDQPDMDGNQGIIYTTMAQPRNFKFNLWGQYQVIGFLGDEYFAAYSSAVNSAMEGALESVPFLYDRSKNRNLMTNEQISKVLMDDDTQTLITTAQPLKLKDGYELGIKSVNANETKVMLELRKDGQSVDTQIITPGADGARMADKTYYYRKNLGDANDIVTIAVHFKNIFRGDYDSATVDGVFQISDTVTSIESDQQYDKMSIRNVDPTGMTITMDNKDNQIILSKNRDILLMKDIHIRTANQNVVDETTPLRYYLYKELKCECQDSA
jgi:S-layer protein (TIGR01567 family)